MTDRHPWIPDQLPTKYRAAQLGTSLYPTRLRSSQKTTEVEKTYKRLKFRASMKPAVFLLYLLFAVGALSQLLPKAGTTILTVGLICCALLLPFMKKAIEKDFGSDSKPVAVETEPADVGSHDRFAALYAAIMTTPGARTALEKEWADMCDLASEATRAASKEAEDPTVVSAYDVALQQYADHIASRLHSPMLNNARAQAILNRVPTDQPGDLS